METNNQNRTLSRRFSPCLKRIALIAVYKIKIPKHKPINHPEKQVIELVYHSDGQPI
jgi:hypothetical protein